MMKKHNLSLLILLAASQFAWSATNAATQEAAARYASDKKLCAEETSSKLRMQCLRDAKAEYDRALAEAKSATASATRKPAAACADCGRVVDVQVVEKQGEAGPLGIIGGGAAGALLGRQVGKGTGKDLATIAGAAAGAYGGHLAEEKLRATRVWVVRVRLDSGEERSFEFAQEPGFGAGDAVRLSGNSIVHR